MGRMFDGQDRDADLESVDSLLGLVREHVRATGKCSCIRSGTEKKAVRRKARSIWDSERSTATVFSSTSSSSIA